MYDILNTKTPERCQPFHKCSKMRPRFIQSNSTWFNLPTPGHLPSQTHTSLLNTYTGHFTHLSHVWINPQILTQTSWTQSQVQTEPFVTLPTSNTPRSFIYRLNVTVRLSYNSLNDTVGDNPVTFKPSQISLSKDQTSVFQSHLKCQNPSEKDKKAVQVL